MWQVQVEPLTSANTLSLSLVDSHGPLSYATVIQLWQQNAEFCTFFNRLLADIPFTAFFWETPPITAATAHRRFECVVIESPSLATVTADGTAFQQHFQTVQETSLVLTFANLGQDALLVVPYPLVVPSVYPHLATFSRQAPGAQQQALWQRVGETLARQLGDQPVWLSTSGLGVSWLHIRLDSRPKYYCFKPYRTFPFVRKFE